VLSWRGVINDATLRAVIAAYIREYGVYRPDWPLRYPAILRTFGAEVPDPPHAPRLSCAKWGGDLPANRWLPCEPCGPLYAADMDGLHCAVTATVSFP